MGYSPVLDGVQWGLSMKDGEWDMNGVIKWFKVNQLHSIPSPHSAYKHLPETMVKSRGWNHIMGPETVWYERGILTITKKQFLEDSTCSFFPTSHWEWDRWKLPYHRPRVRFGRLAKSSVGLGSLEDQLQTVPDYSPNFGLISKA